MALLGSGGALSQLGTAIGNLPRRFWASLTGQSSLPVSSAARGLEYGAERIVNIPTRLIERRPFISGVIGLLGIGALANHFLNGSGPARTDDGMTPEEAGRAMAREELINADNAAQRDVGMAVESMQQRAALMGAPQMAGAMPPSRMMAGPTTMVGGGSYQGRMQAPLEQNVSM